MSLFNELQRRKVFRVAGAYAVIAWLLIQVANTLEESLNLPSWFDTFVVVVLALGFPLALVLAWVFDITPDGIRPADNTGEGGRQGLYPVLSISLLVVAAVLGTVLLRDDEPAIAEVEASTAPVVSATPMSESGLQTLAVLPFGNLSSDTEQEYFADGITEELMNRLSRLQGLQVAGRTSSFYFKGRNDDFKTIGDTLGVQYLLSGTVRRAGDEVRVNAELVKADDGFQLWTRTYERDFADIFALQDEIAEEVSGALSISLGVGDLGRQPGSTRNLEAYEEYLQGLYYHRIFTAGSFPQAIEHYRRAVALDPEFSQAWINLYWVYERSMAMDFQRPDYVDEMNAAFVNAQALTPDLFDVKEVTARMYLDEGNILEADRILSALQAERGGLDAQTMNTYAVFLRSVGRSSEAVALHERARRIDPLEFNPFSLIWAYAHTGQLDKMEAELANPALQDSPFLYNVFRQWLAMARHDTEALEKLIQGVEIINGERGQGEALVRALNDPEAGMAVVRRVLDSPNGKVPGVKDSMAQWAAFFGDPQTALDIQWEMLIDEGLADSSVGLTQLWLSFMSDMRKLPRFKELVQEVGLVDYWRATGNWGDHCRPLEGGDDFECN